MQPGRRAAKNTGACCAHMRPRPRLAAVAACLLALAVGCRQAPPAAGAREAPIAAQAKPAAAAAVSGTLVFKASTAGQIVPCGCSPDQRGGLPRAAAELKKLRAASPGLAYVEAGDLLFESPLPRRGPLGAQAELKARTLARGEETRGNVPLLDAGAAPVVGARAALLVKAGEVPVGVLAAGLGPDPAQTVRAR